MSEGTRTSHEPTQGQVRLVRKSTLRVLEGKDQGTSLDLAEHDVVLIGTHPEADLQLSDDTASRKHAELRLTEGGYLLRDLGSTNGTRYAGARVRELVLGPGSTAFEIGSTRLGIDFSDEEVQQPLSTSDRFGDAVGRSVEMRRLFARLEKGAATDATVLLLGESGTGKEVLAAAIHRRSTRADKPFVVFDCAGVAPSLIESELFGHVAGAFTGAARDRPGLLEDADGGTVFLDEIGELPLDLQPKLLRALAQRQVRRVGGSKTIDIDVRVIAATHRDLRRAVDAGTFRADLFYRIAVVQARVPPLRARVDDIPYLARLFAAQLRPEGDPKTLIPSGVLAALMSYPWPGNVRELRNVVERLISVGDLATALRHEDAPLDHTDYQEARRATLERFERAYVVKCLEDSGQVVTRAAERAGLSRQMFHRLMSRHGLSGR